MCIMLSDHEPETTKLIHLPVMMKLGKKLIKYNMCVYVNNLDTSGTPALMIVPFPQSSDKPFGMMDINTEEMKQFRNDIFDLMPKKQSNSLGVFRNSYGTDERIKVHKVGNYNISIATNLTKLVNGIDWSIFSKPFDFTERLATFSDRYLYPTKCSYVVAQAEKNIKNDGFGILYPDIGVDYFPTAHELTGDNGFGGFSKAKNSTVKYDVECYHFTTLKSEKMPFGTKTIWIHEFNDHDHIKKILGLLGREVILEDGDTTTIQPLLVKRINMWEISGTGKNKNMYIKNELMWGKEKSE